MAFHCFGLHCSKIDLLIKSIFLKGALVVDDIITLLKLFKEKLFLKSVESAQGLFSRKCVFLRPISEMIAKQVTSWS